VVDIRYKVNGHDQFEFIVDQDCYSHRDDLATGFVHMIAANNMLALRSHTAKELVQHSEAGFGSPAAQTVFTWSFERWQK